MECGGKTRGEPSLIRLLSVVRGQTRKLPVQKRSSSGHQRCLPSAPQLRGILPRATAAPRNSALKMAAAVESAMRELHVYGSTAADVAEGSPKAETVKAVAEPGTPVATEKASAESTAEKAKKQRRRRGKKPTGKENIPPAGPVDVAALLKARAAAKKKGSKPVSAAAQAALANAKARPAQKKKAPKGRQVADPGCNGY